MICDHYVTALERCKNTPMRAPRLVVPSQTPDAWDHPPLKMFTTLHFCELHKGLVAVSDLLQPNVKRDMERAAKLKRPLGFKPDFEKAFIEYVLVTTPEYRKFLAALGKHGVMGAAKMDADAQATLRAQLGVNKLAG